MNAPDDGLWWTLAIVDSAVGAGFFIYGIRQKEPLPLILGIALSVLPTVVSTGVESLAITVLIGVGYVLARRFL